MLDLKCEYKISIEIYENIPGRHCSRVDRTSYPVIFKDPTQTKNIRKNFIEMGQSEVVSCLSGLTHSSGGICSFQVKCPKDSFKDDEKTKFLAKLDNTRSRQNVNKIEVKLIRIIRLNTQPIGVN